MLREVKSVNATFQEQSFGSGGGHVELVVGMKRYRSFYKIRRAEFLQMVRRSKTFPVPFGYAGSRRYWRFANRWFWEDEGLGAEQLRTLVVLADRRRQAAARRARKQAAPRPRPIALRPPVTS